MKIKQDAARSQKAFEKIAPMLGAALGGKIVTLEGHKTAFEKKLDYNFGIDGLLITRDGVQAYAQRTQFNKPYRAYSVRKNRKTQYPTTTEWDKLIRAESLDDLRPQLSFSVYVDEENRRADVAWIHTDDLINFIADGHGKVKSHDNGEFYSASWKALRDGGYQVSEMQISIEED